MNNLVFRQRLWHIVHTVRDIEHVKHNGIKRVHFQLKAEGVQGVMAQGFPGLKSPHHIHYAAGQRQQPAQGQQGIAGRVVAVHIRRYGGGQLMSQAETDGQPEDEKLAVTRVSPIP